MCNSSPCLESILVFFLPCRSGISHIPSSRYIVGIITSTFPTRTGVNVHCTWLYFGCSHLSMSSISQIIPKVMSVQVTYIEYLCRKCPCTWKPIYITLPWARITGPGKGFDSFTKASNFYFPLQFSWLWPLLSWSKSLHLLPL